MDGGGEDLGMETMKLVEVVELDDLLMENATEVGIRDDSGSYWLCGSFNKQGNSEDIKVRGEGSDRFHFSLSLCLWNIQSLGKKSVLETWCWP